MAGSDGFCQSVMLFIFALCGGNLFSFVKDPQFVFVIIIYYLYVYIFFYLFVLISVTLSLSDSVGLSHGAFGKAIILDNSLSDWIILLSCVCTAAKTSSPSFHSKRPSAQSVRSPNCFHEGCHCSPNSMIEVKCFF